MKSLNFGMAFVLVVMVILPGCGIDNTSTKERRFNAAYAALRTCNDITKLEASDGVIRIECTQGQLPYFEGDYPDKDKQDE